MLDAATEEVALKKNALKIIVRVTSAGFHSKCAFIEEGTRMGIPIDLNRYAHSMLIIDMPKTIRWGPQLQITLKCYF